MADTQEEISRLCSAVFMLCLGLVAIVAGLWFFLPEPTGLEKSSEYLVPELLCPEKRERSIFILCTMLLPFLAWGAVALSFSKICPPLPLPAALSFFAVGFFCAFYGDYDWFDHVFFFANVPLLFLVFAVSFFSVWWCRRHPLRLDFRVLSAICLLVTFIAVLNGKLYPMTRYCMVLTHHCEPLAYSVSQAANGNFEYGQYGGYALFIAPFFALTGGGMRFFQLVMTLLMLGVVWLLLASLREIRNRWLIVAFFISLVFFAFGFSGSKTSYCLDPYFQYVPIRVLFPAVWMYWLSKGLNDEKAQLFSGIISALALLWNLDSGAAVAGSAIFLLLLRCISGRDRAALRLAGAWSAAFAAISVPGWYLLSGFDFEKVLKIPASFFADGYMMLPMQSPPAVWIAVLGVYAAMLTVGICKVWLAPSDWYGDRRNVMLLGGAVLGIGLFAYYQGRSHVQNLGAVSYVAIWGGTLLIDRLWHLIDRRCLPAYSLSVAVFPAMFAMLCLAGIINDFPRAGKRLPFMVKDLFDEKCGEFYSHAGFISRFAGGRPCIIWSEWQGALHLETGLPSAVPFGCMVEIFDKKEQERVFNAIKDSQAPLFVTRLLLTPMHHLPRYVLENYKPKATSPDRKIWYLEPKSVQR